jgi:membrane fusion protein (multidrug efflux system)
MKKRMWIMLAAVVTFVVAIGVVKALQIRAAIAGMMAFRPPPEAVTTIVARQDDWPSTLEGIGTVAAVQGVVLSADLPGIVETIDFTSGKRVRAGEVVVRLDTRQERAQLAAAEAQLELAHLNLDRSKQLLEKGVVAQAEFDQMAAESKQADARAGEIRATIERKTIRAPFAGVLGIRQVERGQYLNGGDPIVPLQAMDPVYVNFSLPQQDVASLKVGSVVRVSADSIALPHSAGVITAINSVVDEATRNVQVQATLQNPRALLRSGMFVNVEVMLDARASVVALPTSAINYAPYGNSVFIVGDVKGPDGKTYRGVRQQFVQLGNARGDQVAVISGVKPGEEVVTSGVFKLRNGAAVVVNNQTQPENNPAPRPEDS